MSTTPLPRKSFPYYTQGEEVVNTLTHSAGAVFSVVATVLLLLRALERGDVYSVISAALYGFSLICLYTMSSLYHGMSPTRPTKRLLQVLDHCAVFLLIAGTYTPYCLCTLRRLSSTAGWLYLASVWGIALLAILLNALDLARYEAFSGVACLALGWCIAPLAPFIARSLTPSGFRLLFLGGVAYTLGAVLYLFGRGRYLHSLFHLLVLLGTVLHFLSIFYYVL